MEARNAQEHPLTDEILFGRPEKGGTVTVDLQDERLTFSFEPSRSRTPEPAS